MRAPPSLRQRALQRGRGARHGWASGASLLAAQQHDRTPVEVLRHGPRRRPAIIVSGGRIEMAVGVGWMREEFDILGIDWRTRGKRTNEAMAVLRTLWRDPHPEFHGDHYELPPVTFRPKPVQEGGPPLLVAGLSKPAFRRAATLGDGWYGHDLSVGEAAAIITRIDALRDELGTRDRPFSYTTRARWSVAPREVEAFASHGVCRLVLDVGSAAVNGLDTVLERIERIGRDLVGAVGAS